MKRLFISSLAVITLISGCAKHDGAKLADGKITKQQLAKLKRELEDKKAFAEDLEVGYALHQLELEANKELPGQVSWRVGSNLKKDLDHKLQSHDYSASSAFGTMGGVGFTGISAVFNRGLKTKTAISSTAVMSPLSFSGLVSLQIHGNASKAEAQLTAEQQAKFRIVLEEPKFTQSFEVLTKFLSLSSDETRELEQAFRKAIIAVYTRTYDEALNRLVYEEFVAKVDKEVHFLDLVKKMNLQRDRRGAQELAGKLVFLERLLESFDQIHNLVNDKEFADVDSLDIRIEILSSYEEALKANEEKLKTLNGWWTAKLSLESRLKELNALKKDLKEQGK